MECTKLPGVTNRTILWAFSLLILMSYIFKNIDFTFFLLEIVKYSMNGRNKFVTLTYIVLGGPSTMTTTLVVFINVLTLISDKLFRSESETEFTNNHYIKI